MPTIRLLESHVSECVQLFCLLMCVHVQVHTPKCAYVSTKVDSRYSQSVFTFVFVMSLSHRIWTLPVWID